MEASSLRFAAAARDLGLACRGRGLRMPGFRSPPRLDGVNRSLRRRPDGGTTVAVRIRGRPFAAVLADMIEGVLVANGLDGEEADRVREALWRSLPTDERAAAAA